MNLLGIHGNSVQADNLSLLSPGRNTIKGKHIEEPASRFSHFLKVGKAFGKQSKENELFRWALAIGGTDSDALKVLS